MLFNGVSEYRFVGKGIDVANITNVDFADCLEYFEQDHQVKVIVLHIEGMPDARRFIKIARRVSLKKPIIALKTGRSEQGIAAAQSHTGSLAGTNEVWDAALKQAGIIRVDNLEEMVDITRTLSMLPPLENPNIAVATFSGGTGIMALDGMQNSRLRIGNIPANTRQLINRHAPDWLVVGNPLDYWPMVMGAENQALMISEIMEALLQDSSFGGIIFIQIIPDEYRGENARKILSSLREKYPDRSLVAVFTGPLNSEYVKKFQEEGRILAFPTPERASRALVRLWQYSEYRRRHVI
jgi:acetyltransferase